MQLLESLADVLRSPGRSVSWFSFFRTHLDLQWRIGFRGSKDSLSQPVPVFPRTGQRYFQKHLYSLTHAVSFIKLLPLPLFIISCKILISSTNWWTVCKGTPSSQPWERDEHHLNNQYTTFLGIQKQRISIKLQERKKTRQHNTLSHSLMETDKKLDRSEGLILKILHVTEEGK